MAEMLDLRPPVRSALAGHLSPRTLGQIGADGPGVRLYEHPFASLWQIAAWPERLGAAAALAADTALVEAAPGPGRAIAGSRATLLRVEPLKWLAVSDTPLAPPRTDGEATVLDLSHARTRLCLEGPARRDLLACLTAIDLRARHFGHGRVATTAIQGSAVTLACFGEGVELYVLRSFALSLWQHLLDVGAQFGVDVVHQAERRQAR